MKSYTVTHRFARGVDGLWRYGKPNFSESVEQLPAWLRIASVTARWCVLLWFCAWMWSVMVWLMK